MDEHIKNKLAYNYHQAVHDKFIDLCSPLKNLGIKDVYYLFIDSEGRYLFLITSSTMGSYHFFNVKTQGNFFTNKIETTGKRGKNFLVKGNLSQFDFNKDPLLYACWEYDLWNMLIHYEQFDDHSIRGWGFSVGKAFEDSSNFFLERIPLLEKFRAYFDATGKELIDITDKTRLGFFEQQFQFSKTQTNILEQQVNIFLKDITLEKINITIGSRDIALTKRQSECLYYLSKYYSIKEVARNMNLSPKTIETYLQAIKNKSGVFSKEKLIKHICEEGTFNKLELIK